MGVQVVCPEGLNGTIKALLFDFEELPPWNVATMDEPTWDLTLIEVDLNSTEPEALPFTRAEDPLGLQGIDSAVPDPMATSSQVSPHVVMPENIPSIVQVSHSPSLPTMPRTPEMASISSHSTVSGSLQGQSSQHDKWGAFTTKGDKCSLGAAAHD